MKDKRIIKPLCLILAAMLILLCVPFSASATDTPELTVSEAAKIVREWEYIFNILYNTDEQYEYYAKDEPGKYCEYERFDFDKDQYVPSLPAESYIAPCFIKTYGELTAFIEKTYTSKMTREIMNRTRFLFIEGRVYYPDVVLNMFYRYAIDRQYTCFPDPLEERITVKNESNGRKKIEFIYWDMLEDENYYIGPGEKLLYKNGKTGFIEVEYTSKGYRICDFDELLITSYINPETPCFRLTKNNPGTSDSAVYITAAAGLIALFCAVICKKKIKT